MSIEHALDVPPASLALRSSRRRSPSDTDRERVTLALLDAVTSLTGAAIGVLLHRPASAFEWTCTVSSNAHGEGRMLPLARNAALFRATLVDGEAVRCDDLVAHPSYSGTWPVSPAPDPPLRSYLALPLTSYGGGTIGGLFLGHPDRGRFDERCQRAAEAIAGELAAILERGETSDARCDQHAGASGQGAPFEQPFFSCLVGADGRTLEANRAAVEDFGCSRDEVIGQRFWEAAWWNGTASVQQRVREGFEQALHGEPFRGATRAFTAKGEERTLELAMLPVADHDRVVRGVLCTAVDVTEHVAARQRAEAALRESEARYRQLIEGLPAAVYACDAQGRVVLFNELAARLWGREPRIGETQWCGALRMYHPDGTEMPIAESPMALAITHGSDQRGAEAVVERPDGERRNVIVHPQRIDSPGGEMLGAINVLVDITDRKRAEAELAATKDDLALQVAALTRLHELATRLAGTQELEPALEAVLQTLVAIHGADFGLLSLYDAEENRLRAVSSHGFTRELLAEVEVIEALPGSAPCGTAAARKSRVVAFDAQQDAPFEGYRDFAERAGVRGIHSTPILTRSGDLLGVLSVHFREPREPSPLETQFADMCARYAAESIELIRSHDTLREADRRKDEFLATLAHELRNPLAPIRNAMQVIKMAGDDPRAIAETREIVERQLRQIVRLVDDLLDVSRISRGKIELRREPVELAEVIRAAIETSDAQVKQHGHALEVDVPPEPIVLDADVTRLAQVFANLLNNAAKYTEPGGLIRLSVERRGREARVAVRDNGIGIPKEMLPHIFEMFTQVDSSLERAGGGLGVGLTIVRRLVEMHGGRIEVQSDGENRGSEFVVHLPVLDAAAPGGRPAPSASAVRAQPRRILVVDDNVDLATTLARMLSMLGNEVRTVHNGAAAIEATDAFAPDVIFLDIGMPKMNGYEACRRIREGPHGRRPVIVALSGWGQEHDKQRSRGAGMDVHLVKPIDPAALESLLASLPHARGAPARVGESERASPPPEVSLDGGGARATVDDAQAVAAPPAIPIGERPPSAHEPASVEAARYALFRRVVPVLRHDLVGDLQGIHFAVELAARQLRELSQEQSVDESLGRITSQVQEALSSGNALVDWLRADITATATIADAVQESVAMVSTDWSLRGIEVRASLAAAERVVRRQPLREVLLASLLALSDTLRTPADVEIVAEESGSRIEVRLAARVAAREGAFPPNPAVRVLGWDDVRTLARSHGIAWSQQDGKVTMRVARVAAPAA